MLFEDSPTQTFRASQMVTPEVETIDAGHPECDHPIEFLSGGIVYCFRCNMRLKVTLTFSPMEVEELSDPDAKSLGAFARDSETSRQAALAVYPRQGTDRWKILYLLDLASKSGMPGHTRDEIARHVGLPGNTVRPRVRELMDGGWVEQARDEDGKLIRRLSDAGHPADVLRLTALAREAIRREHEDARRARFDAGS